MKKIFFTVAFLLWGSILYADTFTNIGTFDFPTSGSPDAQEHFLLGVGYLHSFGWQQARDEFRKAQELEPDFAMAYWGEAFTYNHPLLPEWDRDSPAQVLKRLGKTSDERLAKAPTEREKGFIRAAEAYAMNDDPVGVRRTNWMLAMKQLYEAFPDDREVAAFYSVSLISASTAVADDDRLRLLMLAGSIANELFRENENHPGAAHYIIHAFDDPVHAPLALVAAKKYAEIAPAVSHARHMPTHIFIQLGMWAEVAKWNVSSFEAAEDLWKPGDRPNDLNHASDWGQYGSLQLANYDEAKQWLKKAEQVLKNNPDDSRSKNTLRAMRARYIVESQQWKTQKISDDTNEDELLAIGMSAVNLNDFKLANQTIAKLNNLAEQQPNNETIKIIQLEVTALTKIRQPNPDVESALASLDEGLAIVDAQRLPNGAANPQKPMHELAGEIYLELGKFQQAADLFNQSLLRTPKRPWSLLGLARSEAALGNKAAAIANYKTLLSIWGDKNLAAVAEAKDFLKPSE